MKGFQIAMLATGLAALAACGGGNQANKAANVTANDVYVVPDDLGGNDVLLNDSTLNSAAATNAAAGNTTTNTTGNSL